MIMDSHGCTVSALLEAGKSSRATNHVIIGAEAVVRCLRSMWGLHDLTMNILRPELHLLQIPGVVSSNMPYFSESVQPHVENSNLFDIAGHLNVTMNRMDGVSNDALIAHQGGSMSIPFYIAISHPTFQGITTLSNNIAIAAVHNSQARFPPPKCSLGT